MATQKDKPSRFIEVVDLASDDRDDDSDIEFVSSSSSALQASLSSKSSSRANSSTGTGTPHRKQPQPLEPGHETPFRPQPPARPHHGGRHPTERLRLHPLPQVRPRAEGPLVLQIEGLCV